MEFSDGATREAFDASVAKTPPRSARDTSFSASFCSPETPPTEVPPAPPTLQHGSHVLRDASDDDRFAWRRRIRANPTALFFYRIGVGLLGLLLMIAAAISGPFPGPGGIPLFLLGLAVWASEFEWAHRGMHWFRRQFDRYRAARPRQKVMFWVCFFGVIWLAWYLSLVVVGPPSWFPQWAEDLVRHLPGVE